MKYYVYEITCKETNKWYVGCSTRKNAHPDQLGKSYFTSSKTLMSLFKTNPENFEIKIIFESPIKHFVYEMETKILQQRNAKVDPNSWNCHNNDQLIDPVKAGKIGGKIIYSKKAGVFARTKEEMAKTGRLVGNFTLLNKIGVHARTKTQIIKESFHSLDHPLNLFHPEGRYLKSILLFLS